ncbi:hypothetical protein CLV24_103216 [Pontibacter ummariensis]|uniref:Uncharacterized protein n=2 Tax=Pontibacter ummariensis TaxID=1610492 RepID=A0A239CLC7_9BACT|nr:hypothetical protein CLV24_103216 [Pontibacter ummariensis]SNS20304.1 hypothetical protein SAMN06296052_10397 [Pontibacter ummariensis]
MKMQYLSFFRSLFGAKEQPSGAGKPKRVIITSSSQPEVLHKRMREKEMSHGETVKADLSPVRLERSYGKMVMYFCPMKSIEVLETLSPGDGGSIPALAKVEGLTIPKDFKPGLYKLKNVTVTSNGTMQVKATEQTTWEVAEVEWV